MTRVSIKDGDFVVTKGRWQAQAVEAIKVSPQMVFYRDHDWNDRERRVRIDDVVFAGPRQIAERLKDQLNSSHDLYTQERNAAGQRKVARDEKYIAAAQAAIASAQSRP